jgi:hypothetical protein
MTQTNDASITRRDVVAGASVAAEQTRRVVLGTIEAGAGLMR